MKKADLELNIIEVAEQICDNYCKYPIEMMMEYEDSEDAMMALETEYCEGCPLNELLEVL